ncbi:bacterial extracellular solute-binding family protein, partial [Vibrio parahaemolyticus VPTS-2010]
IIGRWS